MVNPRYLRSTVDQLECQNEFGELEKRIVSEAQWNYLVGGVMLRDRAKNFFRRSGFYQLAFESGEIVVEEFYKRFGKALQTEFPKVRYLIPLRAIDFGESQLKFPEFTIQKFTSSDLDKIFGTKINNVFFPEAVPDIDCLADYWFLNVKDLEDVENPTYQAKTNDSLAFEPIDLSPSPKRELRYFPVSVKVENAIRRLVLYNWRDHGFTVPCVFALSSDLLARPTSAPQLQPLETSQEYDENGLLLHEYPSYSMQLRDQELANFKHFINQIDLALTKTEADKKWAFIHLALSFSTKAFFSNDLQQLLWHITAIEAILGGQDQEKLTVSLGRRISAIVAETPDKVSPAKEDFSELYKFRCNLVHGNVGLMGDDISAVHFGEARRMARAAIVWALRNYESFSTFGLKRVRKEMHKVLDSYWENPNQNPPTT